MLMRKESEWRLTRKQKYIKVPLLELGSKKRYEWMFVVLFVVSSFAIKSTSYKTIWIIVTSILFLVLLFSPKHLLVALLVALTTYLVSDYAYSFKVLDSTIDDTFQVKKKITMGGIIKYKDQLVLVKTRTQFFEGDFIHVLGKISEVKNKPGSSFDLVTYLKSINVHNIVPFSRVKVISHSGDIRNYFSTYLQSGGENYKKVIPLLLLGVKTVESKPTYEAAMNLNVVHLFVISGFHMNLIYVIFKKVLKLCRVKEKPAMFISAVPLYIYLLFLNFPISASRATLLITFAVLNKTLLKKKFSSLELLSFVMIIFILVNPNSIFSLSFVFSFTATFFVLFANSVKTKSKFKKFILIYLFAYSSNIPIALYINGWISIFGLIFGIALTPVFILTYCLSIFCFYLKVPLNYYYWLFLKILQFFNAINIKWNFPWTVPLWFVQLTYLLLGSYFIISKLWNWYTVKKSSWLRKNLKIY